MTSTSADGGEGALGRPAGETGVQHVARDPAVHLRWRARADLAGGCAAAGQQGGRHVHARHLRGPAVHACRPEGHRLLRVSHDHPKWGQDAIDAHRRVLHGQEGEQLEGGEGPAPYLGSATAENIYLASDPNDVGANRNANKPRYTPLQKKSALLIAKTKHIAQYLDRDTRPDFASTVMIRPCSSSSTSRMTSTASSAASRSRRWRSSGPEA